MLLGCQTGTFERCLSECDPDKCFSVVDATTSLDLEAGSASERESYVAFIKHVLLCQGIVHTEQRDFTVDLADEHKISGDEAMGDSNVQLLVDQPAGSDEEESGQQDAVGEFVEVGDGKRLRM